MHFLEKISSKNLQIIAAFAFGVIFVSVILFLVFSSEDLNQNKMWVVRVVMSLAAAGVAAVLPGFIDLEGKLPWINITFVRAGGALAVFCLVFIYPIKENLPPPLDIYIPPTLPKATAENWINLISEKKYDIAYGQTSKTFINRYSKENFVELLDPIMTALGELQEKSQVSITSFTSPPGFDIGAYSQQIYKSRYSNQPKNVYIEVTLIGEKSVSDWRVYGFRFASKNDDGIFVPLEP